MSEETISAGNEPPQAACCTRCGRPDAAKVGGESICDDCYAECGSCCAGEE